MSKEIPVRAQNQRMRTQMMKRKLQSSLEMGLRDYTQIHKLLKCRENTE